MGSGNQRGYIPVVYVLFIHSICGYIYMYTYLFTLQVAKVYSRRTRAARDNKNKKVIYYFLTDMSNVFGCIIFLSTYIRTLTRLYK